MFQQNGGTYQAYTWKSLQLTAEPQTVDDTFTMEADTDIMSKLVFNCGYQGSELPEHTIYLDNVSLELIDDTNVDYSEIKPYEPPIITDQVWLPDHRMKRSLSFGMSPAKPPSRLSMLQPDNRSIQESSTDRPKTPVPMKQTGSGISLL